MIDSIALNMVVYNEAHRIYNTLGEIRGYVDEVVIVDQESNDGTVEVIERFVEDWGDFFGRFVIVPDRHWGFCEPSRKVGWHNTESDWILVLDADERISDEFAAEMRIIDELNYTNVKLKRSLWLSGEHRFTGDYQHRFFHRNHVFFLDEIHTDPQVKGPRVYSPDYVGIWHEKTWREQIRDEEAYERILKGNKKDPNPDLKLSMNVHLKLLRELGITPEEADAMTIEERNEKGIGAGGA